MTKARQLADLGNAYDDGALSNRNLIINGAMQVAQRGDQSGLTDDAYALDRWQFAVFGSSGHGTYTISQDSSVKPDSFAESLKIDCTVADTSLASDVAIVLRQKIEGQNLQHLEYATANAKDVTLSFWIRSNLTGTGVINLRNVNADKHAGATYTINAADTWEYKTVTIAGDTANKFTSDNANRLEVRFYFAAGSNFSSGTQVTTWSSRTSANDAADLTLDVGSSISNYVNITGLQLEVGDTATPFEHRSYGDELAKCQRYTWRVTGTGLYYRFGVGFCTSTTAGNVSLSFPQRMRSQPSLSYSGTFAVHHGTGPSVSTTTSITYDTQAQGVDGTTLVGTTTGLTTSNACQLIANNDSSAYIEFDAEL